MTNRPARTLVCFALATEAAPFRRLVAARSDLRIVLTGVGRQNAARGLGAALAEAAPELVLSCGYAGGLEPGLSLGEVVFEAEEVPVVRERLLALGARPARFYCSARIVATAAEKAELRQATGADAVDMESETIRQVCRQHRIPSATIRVISDRAGEDLPLDFNRLLRPDQAMSYGKLAAAVLRRPGKIAALLRFQRQCRMAARKLAEALVCLLADQGG